MMIKFSNDVTVMRRNKNVLFRLTISCILMTTACGEPLTPEPVEVQLIHNSDLEGGFSGTDGVDLLRPWREFIPDEENYALDLVDDVSHSPSHSLRIVSTTDAVESVSFWRQSVAGELPIGKSMQLSAYVKLDGLSNGAGIGVSLQLGDDDSAFFSSEETHQLAGRRDWQRVTVTIPALPENVKSMAVFLYIFPNAKGTIYFDDIRLTYFR